MALPQYVKSFVRKGGALLGLCRHREAVGGCILRFAACA